MMKAIQKSSENTNTKTKTMTKTKTKTKTQKKCLKHPTYAIFLKSWWLTHSKYDDRYLTLVILFTPVTLITLVTLFQPYIQFYRAECITVSGFFSHNLWNAVWFQFLCLYRVMYLGTRLTSQLTDRGQVCSHAVQVEVEKEADLKTHHYCNPGINLRLAARHL